MTKGPHAVKAPRTPKVLVVDDDPAHREILSRVFEGEGWVVDSAENGSGALERVGRSRPDVMFVDMKMPGLTGLEVLARLKEQGGVMPAVVMLSAVGQSDLVAEAIRLGAFDYLMKPYSVQQVVETAHKAYRHWQDENRSVSRKAEVEEVAQLIGTDPIMVEIYKTIGRIADSRSTVLITGESGTGKEMVARLIHGASPWSREPFLPIDCASLSKSLIESELFGHEKGAFTGAVLRKSGKFEQAGSGTVFLDEIGNIDMEVQAKLLRVLQDRRFVRVGGADTLQFQARVVAATNVDLEAAVREGRFREDLYYRLAVVKLHLPALRERPKDLPILIDHFLRKYPSARGVKRLSPSSMAALKEYRWPGNVRELEHVIERAVALSRGDQIESAELGWGKSRGLDERPTATALGEFEGFGVRSLDEVVEATERAWIQRALKESRGVQTRAARVLKISLRMLRYKAKKYGVTG